MLFETVLFSAIHYLVSRISARNCVHTKNSINEQKVILVPSRNRTKHNVSTTACQNGTTWLTYCDNILEMLHFSRFHHLWQRDSIRLVWLIQSHLSPSLNTTSVLPLIFVFAQLTAILAALCTQFQCTEMEDCSPSTALRSEGWSNMINTEHN